MIPAMSRLPVRGPRRGSALVLVLVFTTALAMLALSAIYLSSSATILGRSYERERDLRLVAEAGLALGRSRLNSGASVLPPSGFVHLLRDTTLGGADGSPIPDIRLNVYVGPTGGGAGSRGRFASVVAEARDMLGGGRFVRHVELAEESFARFAYFTDQELSVTGTPIYFTRGDVLFGPVWSNDNIRLTDFGVGALATFHADVGTAGTMENPANGIFKHGYRERQPQIELPDTRAVSLRLEPLAAAGGMALDPRGDDSTATLRLQFFAMDMNGDGDSTDANEGFFKAYEVQGSGSADVRRRRGDWLRGTFRVTADPRDETTHPARWENCGDWHQVGGEWQFFPLEVHQRTWFYNLLRTAVSHDAAKGHVIGKASYSAAQWPTGMPPRGTMEVDAGDARPQAIMNPDASSDLPMMPRAGRPKPRCFLGGDPHLIAVADARAERGGTARTLYGQGLEDDIGGGWLPFGLAPHPAVAAARAARGMTDARYVFPLHRDFNPGSLGVIHVKGSAGVSGVVNGGVTLYAENTLLILDDVSYATNESSADRTCNDILGLIAGENALITDNGINTPQDVDPYHTATSATTFQVLDDTPHLELQAVLMSLNTSFRVEGFSLMTYPFCSAWSAAGCSTNSSFYRPVNTVDCFGQRTGRGCIQLFGGIIQKIRGQVARSGGSLGAFGFAKQYAYDRCAATSPPPFFPTIGKFIDNRYYEVDPQRFAPAPYFAALAPRSGSAR